MQTDFTYSCDSSITVLVPLTEAGQEWASAHLPEECPRWGGGYAIESRYFGAIYEGIQENGLSIEY